MTIFFEGRVSLGFTGTRHGMTSKQIWSITKLLDKAGNDVRELHHGNAIGADAEVHSILTLKFPDVEIIKHPSTLVTQQALTPPSKVCPLCPMAPLDRNKHIVDNSDVLVAAPKGYKQEQRSGTWATIRYAWEHGHTVVIVWPNGHMEQLDGDSLRDTDYE
ncbi:hypothetical protein LCGC14_1309850 [marine sediment metagenome]|uniref:DUF2493 domain-containing protein n=1 Tax=marine sediment metagenome TaxID=412755 RepID=A0A0F9KMS5_9ZZZZ